jgi:hypothetical protein
MRQATYNSIVFQAAKQLMNTATAPQALSASFAQNITNMLPTKGGTLAIRHGTVALGNATGDGNIIEIMPFVKADGTSQVLVYTDNGKIKTFDEGTGNYTDAKTGLNTSGLPFYDYFNEGGAPKMVIVNGFDDNMIWDGTSITTMQEYVADTGPSKTWISATQLSLNVGTLGATNYPTSRSVRITFATTSHLNISSITRSGTTATVTTTVANNLVTGDYATITGANQPEYNGTFLITSTGASTFTYTISGAPATPATGAPQCLLSGIQRTTTVSSTSLTGQILTITIAAPLMPAASVNITKLEYQTKPEAFSFIFSAQDRLWAIPGGETLPTTFKNNSKRGYVYFTTSLGVINSWFSPTTMTQAFLDVANRMPSADEIIAVSEYREFIIFFGRNHIQFWKGTDPASATDFGFASAFPLGVVQAKFIQRMPNEVAFMTPYGIRTATLAVQNGTLETNGSIGSAVDTTVLKEVQDILDDNSHYKGCRSFFYPKQGIFGFKFPTKTLTYQVKEESRGWVDFTGDFKLAGAITAQNNGQRLFMAVEGQLMRYADGDTSTTLAYSDRGQAIKWNWWTPWGGGQRRWANHAFEVIHNDSAQINFEISRLKNNSLGFVSTNVLTTSPVMGFWDESMWDEANWDETTTVIPRIRDKFIAQTMSFVVRGETTTGPFEIVSLTCYGQWER